MIKTRRVNRTTRISYLASNNVSMLKTIGGSTVFALRKEIANTLSAYLKPDNGGVSIYKGGIGLLRETVLELAFLGF